MVVLVHFLKAFRFICFRGVLRMVKTTEFEAFIFFRVAYIVVLAHVRGVTSV
jgi:hypothetical protein